MAKVLEFRRPSAAFAAAGVYIAPWQGPYGERVLLAIDERRSLVGAPYVVPNGANLERAGDMMWDRLDRSAAQ